ncbi:hypothetical protein C8J56DRAFT_965537 [Mycena floridula]|nr:hypothetical protein C8J56DRAFT_965537 [Mycena floridula]
MTRWRRIRHWMGRFVGPRFVWSTSAEPTTSAAALSAQCQSYCTGTCSTLRDDIQRATERSKVSHSQGIDSLCLSELVSFYNA